MRKTYHDARHVCSAFIIGADRDIQRSSDDGEPAGTAGVPMMQALLARQTREDGTTDLSDVVAVVVRYLIRVSVCAWVRCPVRMRMLAAWRTKSVPPV